MTTLFHNLLALSIDRFGNIAVPSEVPTGGLTTLEKILQVGVQLFLVGGVILSLLYFIWGGINITMSGGDKTKMESGRKKVIYSIVGLIVMLLAYFIVMLIGQLFGVDLLALPR